MIDTSNVVCIWGGEEAVRSIKRKISPKTEVIEFGPKRSFSIIDLDSIEDMENTACRLANDISVYNQEACFSPQMAFVKGGNIEEFIDKLDCWMKRTAKRWPLGFRSFDNNSHLYINKLKETYMGNRVIVSPENDWCIVLCNDLSYVTSEHPLSRTIYIYQIESVSQVYKFINDNVQAVGVHPWKLAFEYKNELSKRGADRICELGLHGLPRLGFAHDSVFPMSRMVRFISLDEPLKNTGKYMGGYSQEELEFLCFGFYKDKDQLKELIAKGTIPDSYYMNLDL
jgi:long-chain-fatty-acyl-CoA reductase